MVASKPNFNTREKKGFKSKEAKETRESKGKWQANHQTSIGAHNNNPKNHNKANKTKKKGYKRKACLTKAQMEH